MLKFGSNNIGKIYLGSNSIGKAYFGNNLVFQGGDQPTPPTPPPAPSVIYELVGATTTQEYDTGVRLFSEQMSFTIFCDATWNHYDWYTGSQYRSIFGVGTSASNLFRVGRIEYGENYLNGEYTETAHRYCALIMNPADNGAMCTSIYSRGEDSAVRRQLVVRYNAGTRLVKADTDEGRSGCYYTVSDVIETNLTLRFLTGGASGTIHAFKIWDGCLSDEQVVELLN